MLHRTSRNSDASGHLKDAPDAARYECRQVPYKESRRREFKARLHTAHSLVQAGRSR